MRKVLRRTKRVYVVAAYGGKVLVVKNALSSQYWQLPGGGVKRGEDAKKALAREALEEMQLDLPTGRLVRVSSGLWFSENLYYSYEIYSIRFDKQPTLKNWPIEIIGYAWLWPSELTAFNSPQEVRSAVTLSGIK